MCVRCGETKPYDDFVNDRTRNTGKFPWCKPCMNAARAQRKIRDAARPVQLPLEGMTAGRICPGCENPIDLLHPNRLYCSDSCKNRVRNWRTFGLEPDDYRQLIASNEGKCPICRKNVKRWVLDHNHDTGETTGATCSICNQSLLAYSGHDIEIAQRLVDYLRDPPIRELLGGPRYVGPEALEQMERMKGWRAARGPYSIGLASPPYVKKTPAAA